MLASVPLYDQRLAANIDCFFAMMLDIDVGSGFAY
jgi:hypothetical protein